MQLSFDAADRLVELVHARKGAVAAEDAARVLFALERAPATLARSLLATVHGHCFFTMNGTFRILGETDPLSAALDRVRDALEHYS